MNAASIGDQGTAVRKMLETVAPCETGYPGITVCKDCPGCYGCADTLEKALTQDPARRVDVTWDVRGDFKRPVSVKVVTSDRPGMLAKVSQTFSEAGINIASANVRGHGERAVLSFEVSVQDLKQLTSVMRSIERIDGVHSVERV